MSPLLIFIALSGDAQAWYHTKYVWSRDAFPLTWYMADIEEDSVPSGYPEQAFQNAWATWDEDAPCSDLESEYGGVREGYADGYKDDSVITFSMEDPAGDLEGSTLAATLCRRGDKAYKFGDDQYFYTDDCDIVFSQYVDWGTYEDIDAGICNNEYSLQAVATHEIGHLWGLAHTCDDPADDATANKPEGVSCADPELRNATMFWSTGPCTNGQGELGNDDKDGIDVIYGPYCGFEVAEGSAGPYGGIPMEVCFDVACNKDPSGYSWDFGDGATDSSALEVCHTYEEKGQYTVTLTTTIPAVSCGGEADEPDYVKTNRQLAFVLACAEPEPAEGFNGLFTFEHFDGLVYQMINQTDTTVYGCIDQIEWHVFKGDELIQNIGAWSPKIEFPEEGEYRVVLNVGGPGGIAAAEIKIDAKDRRGERSGCSSLPGTAAGLAGLAIAFGAALRRRRD